MQFLSADCPENSSLGVWEGGVTLSAVLLEYRSSSERGSTRMCSAYPLPLRRPIDMLR